ncbi:hypothetical protein QZQ97_05575 [Serratia sp. root2]|uniref:hypothetical protein n=1 Tax=Serratia sp. root2 TaxID=3059676 RepID=UPI00288ECDA4|nr:hypothetical protein [Serratia sp. root2]MDT3250401.1 hypothetical protein [Serratia sp. root2]
MKKTIMLLGLVFCNQLQAAPTADFTASKICKAAISTIMGRDPKIIKVKMLKSGDFELSYKRPTDGSLWGFGCKLTGDNQIMWRSGAEPNNRNYIGRWRTDPADGEITYSLTADKLTINDSMGSSKSFSKTDL